MEQATAAETRADLDRLVADLPAQLAVAGVVAAPASVPATCTSRRSAACGFRAVADHPPRSASEICAVWPRELTTRVAAASRSDLHRAHRPGGVAIGPALQP